MAQARHQAPKGTFDVLPDQERARALVFDHGAEILDAAGFGRIETPTFEETELFERGVGESTDIVRKEMFTFEDQGGRSMTLRPEGTAPICRAYVEHGMHKLPQPVRLWYWGPYFRYERPQEGRFRQFNQIGAETIGTDSPRRRRRADRPARRAPARARDRRRRAAPLEPRHARGPRGLPRAAARLPARARGRALRRRPLADRLQPAARLRRRPRGDPRGDGGGADDARLARRADDAEHLAAVRRMLDAAGVAYRLDGTLVRGLDYYTRTVFEFTCDAARLPVRDRRRRSLRRPDRAARRAADAGRRLGRRDRADPAGDARGAARTASPTPSSIAADGDAERAFGVALELRRARLATRIDLAGRSFKNQMKQADRSRRRLRGDPRGGRQPSSCATWRSGEQREVAEADLAEDDRRAAR